MQKLKTFKVSWKQFYLDTQALASGLRKQKTWKGVVAVTRGGMIPATIVARELGIRHIETVCIITYDDDNNLSEPDIVKKVSLKEGGDGWIVVDDIVDTGTTFKLIQSMLPKAHYASLYIKPGASKVTNTFVTAVRQDDWIIFPWEE
jgi:xanthine phosphoribosyltransferase